MKLALAVTGSLLFSSTVLAGQPFPKPDVDYSARSTMRIESAEGRMTMEGRVFASGVNERREMKAMGREQIMILRKDKGITWILMPQQKMYMESRIGEGRGQAPDADWQDDSDVKLRKVGTETVDGHATTKYEVTAKGADGGTTKGHVWLTKNNIPIRTEGEYVGPEGEKGSFLRKLDDLKTGKQPAHLFEVPDGYRQLSFPSFPGMPGAGGSGGPPTGMTEEGAQQMREQMQQQFEQMRKQMEEMQRQQGGAR